mmetsp:Transcript_77200/g.236238  ORF Transcript_77200/g.236238 Transcript_77200/m.236238 type:complete len:337 (+) Transcript_77200:90-1100(+)
MSGPAVEVLRSQPTSTGRCTRRNRHRLRSDLQLGLAHGQIQHDLLAAAADGHDTHLPVDALDPPPGAIPGEALAAEDLAGLARAKLHEPRPADLDQRDVAAQLLLWVAAFDLIGIILELLLHALDARGHLGNLVPDDLVVDQALAEGPAPPREGNRLGEANAGEAQHLHCEHEALVVEVDHGVLEAVTFFADQIGHRHSHVVELDVRGVRRPPALRLHPAHRDPWHAPLEHEHARSPTPRGVGSGPAQDGEEVSFHAASDPLLRAVHDVDIAFPRGCRADGADIGAAAWLGDAEACGLVARDAIADNARSELVAAVNHDRRQADVRRHEQPGEDAA